jgi:ubiquinone/menaquinone biosynthesis C-methylase UbiE
MTDDRATDRFKAAKTGAARLVEALRAAGEPTRLRLLHLLATEELSVMELVDILGQSQPRISRHLKLMCDAQLIERFPEGAFVFYRLLHASPYKVLIRPLIEAIGSDFDADLQGLNRVRSKRRTAALAYFEHIAPQWDQIRSHYIADIAVETAIMEMVGAKPYQHLIDLGTGSGRMLTLLGPKAKSAIGLDLSQQMLNLARKQVTDLEIANVELRHGDIYDTRLEDERADLVVIHQVLHFLDHPAAALAEAARLLRANGRLLIVDFARHDMRLMADAYHHRRLGIGDEDMMNWLNAGGLRLEQHLSLPPNNHPGLVVRLWLASVHLKEKSQ